MQKLEKDLSAARATYEISVLTECHDATSGNPSDGFMVYPIRIRLAHKEKLTLHFTQERDRHAMMDRIMDA